MEFLISLFVISKTNDKKKGMMHKTLNIWAFYSGLLDKGWVAASKSVFTELHQSQPKTKREENTARARTHTPRKKKKKKKKDGKRGGAFSWGPKGEREASARGRPRSRRQRFQSSLVRFAHVRMVRGFMRRIPGGVLVDESELEK